MNVKRMCIGAVLMALVASPALATEIGDPAPALEVKEWVKGKPVDLKEGKGKNVYVIEFWATWCGPCRVSIPHLTELQKKYADKGVAIIGISSSDRDLDTVKEFVADQAEKMAYTVAYEDSEERKTYKAYMEAFNQNGIPTAFIIDREGRIVWVGHPMGMDKPLEQVVEGKFDVAAFKTKWSNRAKAEELLDAYLEVIRDGEDKEKAAKLAKEIWPLIKDDEQILNGVSWTILTAPFVKYRDLEFALKLAKQANEVSEGKDPAILDTYARALWDTGSKKEAVKYQRKAVELAEGRMKEDLENTLKDYLKELKEE